MSAGERGLSSQLALVVDDDPVIRLLASRALEKNGLRVVEAGSGEEAMRQVERELPDVVLLDVQMPGMDGFETCAELRSHPTLAYLPILMMTGLEDTESVSRAYETGATDFVGKPIHWLLLGHRVRYLLRSSAAFRELSESRARLARSEEMLATAHRIARIATWCWDPDTDVVNWSPTSARRLGEHVELPSTLTQYFSLVHPEDRDVVRQHFRTALDTKLGNRIEHRIVDSLSQVRLIELEFEPHEVTSGIQGTARDQTERWRSEQRVQQLAYYDVLTGLPNRELFMQRFTRAAAQAAADGTRMGLLFLDLDLDHFKQVNDIHGHGTGDAVLRTVAERLRGAMRGRGDGARARDSVGRIGGDEFVALVTDVPNEEALMELADRLLCKLRRPMLVDGRELRASASIGVARYPDDGTDYDVILRKADTAMYRAKAAGRGSASLHVADNPDKPAAPAESASGAAPAAAAGAAPAAAISDDASSSDGSLLQHDAVS